VPAKKRTQRKAAGKSARKSGSRKASARRLARKVARPAARKAAAVRKPVRKKPVRASPRRSLDQPLRQHLVNLLDGRGAHVSFEQVIEDFPPAFRGIKPAGLPFTAWRLLEHMRLAQWDILEFSRDAKHVSPEFPKGYWPESDAPPDAAAWDQSVRAFQADLRAMRRLVQNPSTDLAARISHSTGQTILREALLIADHNAYHLGQLILLRRLLGVWQGGWNM
jgi:hypothetical protein